MRKYLYLVFLLALGLLLIFSAPASAQTASNVVADGLNNPRGLYYDDSGVLWISEAGMAGDLSANTDLGPIKYGSTARVLEVPPGKAGGCYREDRSSSWGHKVSPPQPGIRTG